jgi:Spy/CpxP family protein refolding chaperone
MKKFVLIGCSAAVALAGAIGVARGVENNGNDNAGRPHRFRRAMRQQLAAIGVTDAQKEQIRAIRREMRPTVAPLVKQLVQERRALRNTIQTTPVNEAAIRAQSARVAQLQADLAVKRAYISERVRSVLTPEQAAKLKELAAQRDAKIDERMNRRQNGGGA